jgi:hypothetical protein
MLDKLIKFKWILENLVVFVLLYLSLIGFASLTLLTTFIQSDLKTAFPQTEEKIVGQLKEVADSLHPKCKERAKALLSVIEMNLDNYKKAFRQVEPYLSEGAFAVSLKSLIDLGIVGKLLRAETYYKSLTSSEKAFMVNVFTCERGEGSNSNSQVNFKIFEFPRK